MSEDKVKENKDKTTDELAEPEEVNSDINDLQKDISNLIKQLNETQSIAEKSQNDYLRAVADLDNYRRRVIREKDELRKNSIASFAENLVPVVDNLALAIQAAKKDKASTTMVEGIEMVLNQLRNVLDQQGIKVINPEGDSFDPNLHECVSHVPSEEFEVNQVIEVIRVGYSLNQRLLRPATVVVSQGKEKNKEDEE